MNRLLKRRMEIICCLIAAALTPMPAGAGFNLADKYISILGGYDSNVWRSPSDNSVQGERIEGDTKMLFYGGLGIEASAPGSFQAYFNAKPYYIKYRDSQSWDRGELFLTSDAKKKIGKYFVLSAGDKYRYTYYPNREGRNQIYNSFRLKIKRGITSKINLELHYRNLYRDRPRHNLFNATANGAAIAVLVDPTARLHIGMLAERDYQSVEFVFPRRVDGRRTWADISIRYFVRSSLVLMGKYLYQRDTMDIIFEPGGDLEEQHESGEEITDGILQSLRFLDDTNYNYRKHLLMLSLVSKLSGRVFVDAFGLFQRRYDAEKISELPGKPLRMDDTSIAQISLQIKAAARASLVLYYRYENNNTNDPDHDYEISSVGAGGKFVF